MKKEKKANDKAQQEFEASFFKYSSEFDSQRAKPPLQTLCFSHGF